MNSFDMSIPPGRFVETEHEARQWIQHFLRTHRENGGLGLDSETTGIKKYKDKVIVWSLSDGVDRICLPSKFIPLFKEPILENPEINFDLTNAKFDAHMFANSGADISKAGMWRDTIGMDWLLNENRQGRHGLKECTIDYFGRETPTFESVFGRCRPKKTDKATGAILFEETSGDLIYRALADPVVRERAADYASLDAYNTTRLRAYFDEVLKSSKMFEGMTLFDYFYSMEAPFTKVLYMMERRGVTVDAGYLRSLEGPMVRRMSEIQAEFTKEANTATAEPWIPNLNNPKDIRWFFYEHLKKAVTKMTKGGASGNRQPSTDAAMLEQWAEDGCYWSKKLLEFRSISKIYGTYVSGLMEWLDPYYRIHTSLNQFGTVTGRLSSSEPNLQNIPRPSEDEFRIRDSFIPGERMRLLVADYEQLEMRLMAHFSGDEKMIKAIWEGTDLHCLTVSEMHGIPYDDVMAAKKAEGDLKKGKRKEPLTEREEELLLYRQAAKATGFGIIYGIGGGRLAVNLSQMGEKEYTEEEGFRLIDQWFGVFPGVKTYISYIHNLVNREGKVQVITGRWRRFGDLKSMTKKDAAQAERQAVNSIVQGTAAEIAKTAMLRVAYSEVMRRNNAHLLLQIHDELMIELPDDNNVADECKAELKNIMEHPFAQDLKVPLPASIGQGYSWSSAK